MQQHKPYRAEVRIKVKVGEIGIELASDFTFQGNCEK
jgi:hypothetical protein